MFGIDLIRKAIRLEYVNRIPWVPFVGCHAGKLLGITAKEFLTSSENIVNGVAKAIELYKPDGIPVIFDLQVEAEALGCQLYWPDDNPPAVVSHPLSEGKTINELTFLQNENGRIPLIMEAAKQLRLKYPKIALYGLITGPFTLALHLTGTDIFLKIFEEPDFVHEIMSFSTDVAIFMVERYKESGCDIIALVDPMTSQIDPVSFETFVSPYATKIFNYIKQAGLLSSFFVCGNAKQNIEVMCQCRPDNISIDENIPLSYVRDVSSSYNISFGGNMKLTVSLLLGNENDARMEALECMDIGGKKGFILSPGCDLPMNTPVNNLIAVSELVFDEVLQGKLRASEAPVNEVQKLVLSDHWSQDKVIIDIITLDSSSCAPCQYMVNAVTRASQAFGNKVIFKEYSIKEKIGVQMMASLNVQNIPTIVIDGNIEFVSQIPPVNKIEAKIREYINAKSL